MTDPNNLLDASTIVGVGTTPFTMKTERSNLALAAYALREALEDAGIEKSSIDGFVTNIGRPTGMDYDELAESLGLDAAYTLQTWDHGWFSAPALQIAVMAVAAGLASTVACIGVAGTPSPR